MRMPFGRRHDAITVPTGSLSLRITSSPAAIASTRSASSDKPVEKGRRRAAGFAPPPDLPHWRRGLSRERARIALAIAASARFFCAAGASASARAAWRAARPSSRMVAVEPIVELPGSSDRLERGVHSNPQPCPDHGLDPSCIPGTSYHVRDGPARRAFAAGQLPTAIHSIRRPVTEFEEHHAKLPAFAI